MATVNTDLLTNRPSLPPPSASKPLSTPTNGAPKATKSVAPTALRVDLQPLYATLKELVGDKWQRYISIVSDFMLGGRNQAEITRELEQILQNDAAKEHAHNQLIMALAFNCTRDAPEPGIASWVSAIDKPTLTTKPVAGDAAEQRLKAEVMQLPARDRHRIKSVQDEPVDTLQRRYQEAHAAKTVKPPEVGPGSTGGFNKTNWDLEIRKRYQQQLFAECNDFPDVDAIRARMVPICYEMGVGGGAGPNCVEYVSLAADTFVKRLLTDLFERVRSNGEGYIKTAAYKRRLEREEAMWLRQEGGVVRNAAGLLPVEVEASEGRRPFGMSDFRLALKTADGVARRFPVVAAKVNAGWSGTDWDWDAEDEGPDDHARAAFKPVNGMATGTHPIMKALYSNGDDMDIDSDWGWSGGGKADVDVLDGVLDDCLAT